MRASSNDTPSLEGPQSIKQLVVTDLDGTLWDSEIRCHPATLDALSQLGASGVPVLVATGRRASSAARGLADNGLALPSVLLNGALGIDVPKDHRFHAQPFTKAQSGSTLDVFTNLGLTPCVYLSDGRIAVGENVTSSETHRSFIGHDFLGMEPEAAIEQFDVLTFSCYGQEKEAMEAVVAGLESTKVESNEVDSQGLPAGPTRCADYSIYPDPLYGNWTLTTQPPGISKREGIEAYLDYANIAPQQILALGDGGNDLEMLEAADVAFSMEDAAPEAQALADVIIPPPHEGGWAQILDHLS